MQVDSMLTHGKRGDLVFCFLPASHQNSLCFSGGYPEAFAHSEQNNLDIWNKTGMIEVIDSMNQIETPEKKISQTGNKSGRSLVLLITTE
jgi:hypothetical protein